MRHEGLTKIEKRKRACKAVTKINRLNFVPEGSRVLPLQNKNVSLALGMASLKIFVFERNEFYIVHRRGSEWVKNYRVGTKN